MNTATRKLMTAGLLGLGLAILPLAGPASAQSTGDSATTGSGARAGAGSSTGSGTMTTSSGAGTTTTERHDEGFNPGWLGLIGLAGLAGLLPKKTHTVTTTTHRPSDPVIR